MMQNINKKDGIPLNSILVWDPLKTFPNFYIALNRYLQTLDQNYNYQNLRKLHVGRITMCPEMGTTGLILRF
jgi:hypothetical protein